MHQQCETMRRQILNPSVRVTLVFPRFADGALGSRRFFSRLPRRCFGKTVTLGRDCFLKSYGRARFLEFFFFFRNRVH